jgi:hypothetical protein
MSAALLLKAATGDQVEVEIGHATRPSLRAGRGQQPPRAKVLPDADLSRRAGYPRSSVLVHRSITYVCHYRGNEQEHQERQHDQVLPTLAHAASLFPYTIGVDVMSSDALDEILGAREVAV